MASTPRILFEVTIATVDDALAAVGGGADRLEVCSALEVGGLTPSLGLVEGLAGVTGAPLVALLRPRAGDFEFSRSEFSVMRRDLDHLLAAGVQSVAIGVLRPNRNLDTARCAELVRACAGREVVCHRAFDLTPDQPAALEQLIDLGVHRVLTGGGHPQVAPPSPGAAVVARLIRQAAGRIEILPAGGIRASNVLDLIRVTGCTQVHSSCRLPRHVSSAGGGRAASFGFGAGGDDAAYRDVDPDEVAAVRWAMDTFLSESGQEVPR